MSQTRAATIHPLQSQLTTEQRQELVEQLLAPFRALLCDEKIADMENIQQSLQDNYLPIAHWLLQQQDSTPFYVGINGAQGSGKSTLCKILSLILQQGFNKSVATLSIDDLYHTRAARQTLAKSIHPLLATRGVPGTHDIALGQRLFTELACPNGEVQVPRFDKSQDDRAEQASWCKIELPVDIVLFEGWCVGSQPQDESTLAPPINHLEQEEDQDGTWRRYVNQQLTSEYAELFQRLNCLIMLEIPDFNKVLEWRTLQEQKLKEANNTQYVMNDAALNRFIMHYERITRANLAKMPEQADLLIKLDDRHQISGLFCKEHP